MRFLWCVVLATLAFSQDLKLDLSLEEDTSSSSSIQKQDDDFLNSLELELNQAAKESKPQEEDEEISIPQPSNPDPKLSQSTPQQEQAPQTIIPSQTQLPKQEAPQQKNNIVSQEKTQAVGQNSSTLESNPQDQENQEAQIPQDNSQAQNTKQTPISQALEQSSIQTPNQETIPQPQPTQQAPQIQQTPNTPTPQSQETQAPLTSQTLQNSTPLPTKNEHLTYREKIKIISREELLKRSNRCDEKGEEKVCFDVGMIYYQGRSEKGQNLQEAYHYLEKSCKGKKGLGCYEAGIVRANSGVDLPYSATLLNRACELGDLRGCRNLAILYYNGQGVPKNIYQAFNLFKKGCEAGDQKSCLKFYLGLGNSYRDTQNYPKAKVMYEKACKLGEQAACNELYLLSRKAHPSTRYLFGNSQNKP